MSSIPVRQTETEVYDLLDDGFRVWDVTGEVFPLGGVVQRRADWADITTPEGESLALRWLEGWYVAHKPVAAWKGLWVFEAPSRKLWRASGGMKWTFPDSQIVLPHEYGRVEFRSEGAPLALPPGLGPARVVFWEQEVKAGRCHPGIYADWCDENGMEERGKALRL